jgi:hypothetical protein
MKKLILPFLFLLPAVAAQAQEGITVRGSVSDGQNTEIAYANVALLSASDSILLGGTMTDEKGLFEFSCENTGGGILRISFIGYEDYFRTITADGNSVDAGKCILHEKTVGLEEVAVTARRPQITMRGSTLVTSIANSVLSNAGTASDILKYVPSVMMNDDDDRITVLGKGAPEIYIDNRKVRDNSELKQLRSTDIARVELVRNPGALYDAETRAVLKIITIKRYAEGFMMQLWARGRQNERLGDTEAMNFNYKIRGLTLSLSYMHWTGKRIMTYNVDQVNRGDTVWKEKQYSTYLQDNPNHSLSSSVSYDINPQHSAGMQYRFLSAGSKGASQKGNDWYEIYAGDELYTKASVDLVGNGNTKQHTLNFFYDGRISERLHTHLDADYLAHRNNTSQYVSETAMNGNVAEMHTRSLMDYDLYAAKLTATYSAGEQSKLTFGAEYAGVEGKGEYRNEENKIPGNQYTNSENKLAAFAMYNFSAGKVGGEISLRYEHVDAAVVEYGHTVVDRLYSDLFPSLSLSWPVGKTSMALALNSRVARPAFWQLNSNVRYNNQYHQETGNPSLKPQKIYDAEYMFGYSFLQLGLNYQYVKDYISTGIIAQPSDAVTFLSSVNYPEYRLMGAMLSASHTVGRWKPVLSAGIYRQLFDVEYNNTVYSYNRPYARIASNNTFTLPQGFILSANLEWNTAGSSDMYDNGSYGSFDMSLRKEPFQQETYGDARRKRPFPLEQVSLGNAPVPHLDRQVCEIRQPCRIAHRVMELQQLPYKLVQGQKRCRQRSRTDRTIEDILFFRQKKESKKGKAEQNALRSALPLFV